MLHCQQPLEPSLKDFFLNTSARTAPAGPESATHAARRYGPDAHGIRPEAISPEALHVVRTLRDAGHDAYLVGGCVRDLLLGRRPKDFDVSTSAHPDEVHGLFRRSRIVGRRFQIVHVRSGREIIEVSTFRGHHSPGFDGDPDGAGVEDDEDSSVCANSGMLLRDNVFGTLEEDALRRDFTVNGLYYDPDLGEVVDYSTGVKDLAAGVLRVVGEPAQRFQEDPVRMLRAIRFAARLDFRIDPFAVAAIARCRQLIEAVPAARMFEEVLKLLLNGRGEATFLLMEQHRLFEPLFPETAQAIRRMPRHRNLLVLALRNSDERLAQEKTVTPAFLFAALLWPPLLNRVERLAGRDLPPVAALHEAATELVAAQVRMVTIPRRFSTPMREIWDLQHRLESRRGAQRLMTHPRFRAAYDFLMLRELSGEELGGAGDWWSRMQAGEPLPVPAQPTADAPPRRRRRRRPPRGEGRARD
ncbi:MAG: polynucleotide adenylyltransferase PcnB [Gammaproteobacteria bacterium]